MSKAIPEHIIDGAIEFNSVEAGSCLLTLYPGVPELLRLQADLLASRNCREAAAGYYSEAAKLFLSAGKILQALVTKSLEWRLIRPSRKNMLKFHFAVEATAHNGSPLNVFLQCLNPLERMALFAQFERRVFPAGKTIVKIGAPENALSFVVSGKVKENQYQRIDQRTCVQREASTIHTEGGFFGEIYPLNAAVSSSVIIDTLTRVELATLSKRRLIQLSWKYPNVQQGLLLLYRIRRDSDSEILSAKVRKGERYRVPVRMAVEFPAPAQGGTPGVLKGYTRDLSISGMSFIVEANDMEEPTDWQSMIPNGGPRNVCVRIPSEGLSIAISGTIVRSRRMVVNGNKTAALYIQFAEIPPCQRGVFFSMASSLNGHHPPPEPQDSGNNGFKPACDTQPRLR